MNSWLMTHESILNETWNTSGALLCSSCLTLRPTSFPTGRESLTKTSYRWEKTLSGGCNMWMQHMKHMDPSLVLGRSPVAVLIKSELYRKYESAQDEKSYKRCFGDNSPIWRYLLHSCGCRWTKEWETQMVTKSSHLIFHQGCLEKTINSSSQL